MSTEERTLHAEMQARYTTWLNSKAAANIDYLAMMTDVEIPTDEEQEGDADESEI